MANLTVQLERLRKWRTKREKDISIGSSIIELRKTLKKTNRQLVSILERWDKLVPEQLNQNATPTSLKGGVLSVTVSDSPTAYHLNRLIRSSLLRDLQQCSSGTLRHIKVSVAN